MKPPPTRGRDVDALLAEVLRAGEDGARLRDVLDRQGPDDTTLRALLLRPVPVRLLEMLGATPPWSGSRVVLGGVVLNPRTPRSLGLRLLPDLFWHDLAEAAASARVSSAVRSRAESTLLEQLPQTKLGERITLARIATRSLLRVLLLDADPKVVAPCLDNPRLREEDLVAVIGSPSSGKHLFQAATASSRWAGKYAVRLALVLQPRTPLALALAPLSSLLAADLRRVAEAPSMHPLVAAAAAGLLEQTKRAQKFDTPGDG